MLFDFFFFLDYFNVSFYQIWCPPTPPADDADCFYVDIVLDMAYDTKSTISPAELASIAPFR